jgi:hypothetical protein
MENEPTLFFIVILIIHGHIKCPVPCVAFTRRPEEENPIKERIHQISNHVRRLPPDLSFASHCPPFFFPRAKNNKTIPLSIHPCNDVFTNNIKEEEILKRTR